MYQKLNCIYCEEDKSLEMAFKNLRC